MNVNLQSLGIERDRKCGLPDSRLRPLPRMAAAGERVLTCAWLSDKLPDRFISETLAQRVHVETGRTVALVSLEESQHPVNGFNDGQHYVMLNVDASGEMVLPSMAGPVAHIRVQVPIEGISAGVLNSMVTRLKERYHYVL